MLESTKMHWPSHRPNLDSWLFYYAYLFLCSVSAKYSVYCNNSIDDKKES